MAQPPAVVHVPVHVPEGKPLCAQSKHGLLHVDKQHFLAAPPQWVLAQSLSTLQAMPFAVLHAPVAHTTLVPHDAPSALHTLLIESPEVDG